jgi:hypothetical protein
MLVIKKELIWSSRVVINEWNLCSHEPTMYPFSTQKQQYINNPHGQQGQNC